MVIKRTIDGKEVEIELSARELSYAYYEYEHICDVKDVQYELDQMIDEEFEDHGLTRARVEELIDEIARNKRRNMDEYDMSPGLALDEAFRDFWHDYGEETEET